MGEGTGYLVLKFSDSFLVTVVTVSPEIASHGHPVWLWPPHTKAVQDRKQGDFRKTPLYAPAW